MTTEKATQFSDIVKTIDLNLVIDSEHCFFVDFSGVRGDFKEKKFYGNLNVDPKTFVLDDANLMNPKLVFFAGHRGSGKTTEISKYVEKMQNPDCFYCVICNLDTGLDINNIDFVDISIYILETLVKKLEQDNIKIKDTDIKSFYQWYYERVHEINETDKNELKIETQVGVGFSIPAILKLLVNTRASLSGTDETKNTVRRVFTNRFTDFALKFNEFIARINLELQRQKIARNLLFVIDGIEKAYSVDITRKIILDESNRLRQLKTNLLFTLPFGLMKERGRLELFSKVISFPVIKIMERNGAECKEAYEKFKEFIFKRIDPSLFDKESTVKEIIRFGGGSPREVLRILESARIDAENQMITKGNVNDAVKELSSAANYLTEEETNKLKEIADANATNGEIYYDEVVDELMQKNIVFEYNDGSYKRVNPVIEISRMYQKNVLKR